MNLTDSVQVSCRARKAPRDTLNLFKSPDQNEKRGFITPLFILVSRERLGHNFLFGRRPTKVTTLARLFCLLAKHGSAFQVSRASKTICSLFAPLASLVCRGRDLNLTDSVQVSCRARKAPRDTLNLFKSPARAKRFARSLPHSLRSCVAGET